MTVWLIVETPEFAIGGEQFSIARNDATISCFSTDLTDIFMLGLFGADEKLKSLKRLPTSSRAFQVPIYAYGGDDLFLAYYIEPSDQTWNTDFAKDPSSAFAHMPHALVRFRNVVYFSAEFFEDSTIGEHRFAGRGLGLFSQVEVENSALIEHLTARHSRSDVHQHHYPSPPHHFIFSLHGQVFEIVASGFDLQIEKGALLTSLNHILQTKGKYAAL